jgi:endonuclease G
MNGVIGKVWLLVVWLVLLPVAVSAEILRLDYTGGFTVWLDCEKRGAVKFRYNAQRDTGDAKRSSRFYTDSKVPARCQQTSTSSYKRPKGEKPTYDRGHLVPANHLDHDSAAIRQTNTMTNILPQVASMNRGAWKHTEEIVECYRDIDELLVIGGVLWGNDTSNDYFVESHGITTPDAFWKVIIREGRVIAWIIPNSAEAKHKVLDQYLVPVRKIEQVTGEKIPV